jgi:hypothetical protein
MAKLFPGQYQQDRDEIARGREFVCMAAASFLKRCRVMQTLGARN